MRTYDYFFITMLSALLMIGCRSSTKEVSGKSGPGPVTESDKSRYNLNPTDELRYGTLDSANLDSMDAQQDSVRLAPR
ncbi:hypothetical protein [Sphingobacterium yanglingense]|uniref:Uncharacterized protein n=1 Tax=Sphingobacterium yanglingense TaxID=1437280 RepID=A0A4R6WIE3_9SPHI|nr:hypothetical protein [Sphingobacterium yanglingense]TDQ80003.1 hypothetical protein CLV99_1457 [Sphingobacterium yanglingense]